MSLLDSLLSSVKKTQEATGLSRKVKEAQEAAELTRRDAAVRERELFTSSVGKDLDGFAAQSEHVRMCYKPMRRNERLLVHEVAERRGFVSHNFGVDEVNSRFVMVFKAHAAPGEDEMMRLHAKYTGIPMLVKSVAEESVSSSESSSSSGSGSGGSRKRGRAEQHVAPVSLTQLGTEKRDLRTIEQMQRDVIEAKRQRIAQGIAEPVPIAKPRRRNSASTPNAPRGDDEPTSNDEPLDAMSLLFRL
jgi:R3H domain